MSRLISGFMFGIAGWTACGLFNTFIGDLPPLSLVLEAWAGFIVVLTITAGVVIGKEDK